MLRRMIEGLGLMTMINGVVGNNMHSRLRTEEFQGFALADHYVALIFVDGSDPKSVHMFTLAHELGHTWFGAGELSGFGNLLPGGMEVEDWCNRAAAEFLQPSAHFGSDGGR